MNPPTGNLNDNQNVTIRRMQLSTLLEERGLALRPDSKLCWNYINRGQGELDFIVSTMEEMQWYYEYGNYTYEVMQSNEDLAGNRSYNNMKGKVRARRFYLKQRLLAGGYNDDELIPPSLITTLCNEICDAYIEEATAILLTITIGNNNSNNNNRAMLFNRILLQPRNSELMDDDSKAILIGMLPAVVRQELQRWFGPEDAYQEIAASLLKKLKQEAVQFKKQQTKYPVYHTIPMRNFMVNKRNSNSPSSTKQWREERHQFYRQNKEYLARHWEIDESYVKEIFMEITNDYKKYRI